MPDFTAQFYLASNLDIYSTPINEHNFSLSLTQIGILGQLYSSNLIRHLGQHFYLYTVSSNNSTFLHIHNTTGAVKTGRIEILENKQKAAAISGSLGEVLIIPGLASTLAKPMNNLTFHRIKAHQMKCPDYRVALTPDELNALWPVAHTATTPISNFPLEVKTCLGNDNYYPIEALHQLFKYWEECGSSTLDGHGIIARINVLNCSSVYT